MTKEENRIRKIKHSYELRIKNLEDQYSLIIEGKDKLIKKYESEIEFYRGLIEQLSTRAVMVENKIQNKIDHSRKIDISGKTTINASGAGAFNLGDISGTVANTINQLPSSPDPNQPGIRELLTKLQQAIETETELDDLDKSDALEEVQILAEASQNDDRNAKTIISSKSVRRLGRIVNELPDTATLPIVSQEVLPAIANSLIQP